MTQSLQDTVVGGKSLWMIQSLEDTVCEEATESLQSTDTTQTSATHAPAAKRHPVTFAHIPRAHNSKTNTDANSERRHNTHEMTVLG